MTWKSIHFGHTQLGLIYLAKRPVLRNIHIIVIKIPFNAETINTGIGDTHIYVPFFVFKQNRLLGRPSHSPAREAGQLPGRHTRCMLGRRCYTQSISMACLPASWDAKECHRRADWGPDSSYFTTQHPKPNSLIKKWTEDLSTERKHTSLLKAVFELLGFDAF